ncbi:hypothetical protein LTR91_008963 [Friedmanniomyces endolithicus]|uniref:Uncharacterized protein n=1 Tax=Friedmanniomyces endolithicus TaxID=329885 RepID=A0AAN6KMA7_9PEZI|nr:hypothetical protein LTR94_003339 [Friedmanniomyces endolithicus]KAK0783516.1 hypothetical protein LTR59_011780 [Friedmanniomyces endolithicus]KAK0783926.1 hypothetical protein LTR75_013963 [Friedmanniomyces endolithicus]KAK0813598.1 hypothetical protein LTR38_002947 [Friedmanniomyces endolithicus]KAK0848999.1 hypothetical protein LTS02_013814 [Friedmanniomyces endolithicus]
MVETGRPYLAPLQNVCEGAHDRARRSDAATDDELPLPGFVNALATWVAVFPRSGIIEGTAQSVRDCLNGGGSMQKDLQSLGNIMRTAEAQKAVSGFIEHTYPAQLNVALAAYLRIGTEQRISRMDSTSAICYNEVLHELWEGRM